MRKLLSLLILLPLCALAQPKWTKKAQKSLVTLRAVQQSGDTLWVPAFYVDNQGTVVAPLKPLMRAREAWVENAAGRRQVSELSGFSTTYDICRLTTTGKAKAVPLSIGAPPEKGAAVYLMPDGQADEVTQVEAAGERNYYTLKEPASFLLTGQPLLDAEGRAVGILQNPIRATGAPNYALDIRLPMELSIKALDANNADLRTCLIPRQLPATEDQARSFLYLVSTTPDQLIHYARRFTELYPKANTGYVLAAEAHLALKQYDEAQAAYEEALKKQVDDPNEVLYARSQAIYNAVDQGPDTLPADWTLDGALADVRAAMQHTPLPVYTLHEARILFAQKQYAEANDRYLSLTRTNMRTPDLFIYAARCQEKMGLPADSILCMNDSAVAEFTQPYPAEAANYFWLRAMRRRDAGQTRPAIRDMNVYEHLKGDAALTDLFYYQREQLEASSRMLPQALADIAKAIELRPDQALYHAEHAVLLYRAGEPAQAIEACTKTLELDPAFTDAHRIWGICLLEQGKKAEAKEHLQKAVELGDEAAQSILSEQYK